MRKITIKLLDNPRGLRRDHPSMIPSLRSGCVQRCSEKSTSLRALFWTLELNKKIFSPHKQALRMRMRWPAVLPIRSRRYELILRTNRPSCGTFVAIRSGPGASHPKLRVILVHVIVNYKNRVAVAVPTKRASFVIFHPTVFLNQEVCRLDVKRALADTAARTVGY